MAQDLVAKLKLENKEFREKLKDSNKQLKNMQNQINMIKGGYHQLNTNINKVSASLNKSMSSFQDVGSGISGMLKQIKKINPQLASMIGSLSALGAVGSGAFKMLKDNVTYNMELNDSLSSLQAIIGTSKESMRQFREEAIALGAVTPQTAGQVAEAFKIIAMMKPELAQDKEALSLVTKASLDLANAQGTDVATAADIATRALNVYGASARQAAKFANILAAGARSGSGDIMWIGEAFGKAGAAARAVNMSYSETVTVLELLSTRIKDAQSAGAQLRNILIYLEKQNNDKLKPSVVGIEQALKNLRDKLVDAETGHLNLAKATDMFKKQNVEAIATLMDSIDKFDGLQKKINESNVATEMANIKQDTLRGALNRLDSAWQGWILHLGDSNGFLATFIDHLAEIIQIVPKAVRTLKGEISKMYDKNLTDMATTLFNQGLSSEEIKKQLREQLKSEAEALKREIAEADTYLDYNNKGRTTTNEQRKNYLNQYNRGRARLLVVEENLNTIDMLVDDVYSDIQAAQNKGLDTLLDNSELEESNKQLKKLSANEKNALKNAQKLADAAKHFKQLAAGGVGITTVSNTSQTNLFSDPALIKAVQGLSDDIAAELDKVFNEYTKKQEFNNKLLESNVITQQQYDQESIRNQDELLTGVKKVGENAVVIQEKEALNDLIVPILKDLASAQNLNNRQAAWDKYVKSKQGKFDNISKSEINMTDINQNNTLSGKKTALHSYDSLIKQYQELMEELPQMAMLQPEGTEMEEYLILIQGVISKVEELSEKYRKLKDEITEEETIAEAFLKEKDYINGIASAVSSLGSAFSSMGENGAAAFMQILAQAVQLIPVIQALAMAEGVEGAARTSKHWAEAIAGIAAISASIIAAFHQKFADGGIVKGGSYSGDSTLVRVNAGEMILNRGQQANLFKMLNEGISSNASVSDVHFKIQGRDLVGVLNNYNNKMSKLR